MPKPALAALILLLSPAFPCFADWKDEIGYTRLRERLGPSLPTGGSIQATQVEMPVDSQGDYLPDRSDAQLAGKIISGLSGNSGISNHATVVGQYYCGLTSSIGPGIQRIATYEANDWSGRGCLNLSTALLPERQVRLVQNHSWVGTFGRPALDSDVLRRLDLAVERDGVLVTAGVKNGATTAMPELVCSAYNVISVGLTNGRSSRGPTRIETAGRVKPDLVAPLSATSWATPVVASSASLLLESIDAGRYLKKVPASERPTARQLLTRALLMGGATKEEWPDWRRGFATPCSDGSVPLDYRYGAGELNVDNSYRILTAGQQPGGGSGDVPPVGWDYNRIAPHGGMRYSFHVSPAVVCRTLSVLVTWNRHIDALAGQPLVLTPSLANIDLRLYRAAANGRHLLIDSSVSKVDNVEHVFLRNLPPGRYLVEVISDLAWDYCLTWDAQLEPAPPMVADAGSAAAPPASRAIAAPAPAAPPVRNATQLSPAVLPVSGEDDTLIKKAAGKTRPLMP